MQVPEKHVHFCEPLPVPPASAAEDPHVGRLHINIAPTSSAATNNFGSCVRPPTVAVQKSQKLCPLPSTCGPRGCSDSRTIIKVMLFTLFIGVVLIAATAIMVSFGEMLRVTLFGSKNAGPGRFEPSRDIASFAGKVVLITGAAGDLGRKTALELARWGRPSKIYIADLPRDKALVDKLLDGLATEVGQSGKARDDEATASTTFHFLPLDLTSFDSVRDCAARFAAQEQRLDLLILNAGIIRVATQTTSNGYEVHFGLNYLGHALLSKLLIPVMLRTAEMLGSSADVRVVIVSSEGYLMAPKGGIQFDKLKTECKDMVSLILSSYLQADDS